jgi:hypothetical protein
MVSVRNQNPKSKTLKNVLLMQEQYRLLTNDDVQTCRNKNKLKKKTKTSTQDNVF